MPPRFDLSSVRAKIDRAAEHLAALDAIVGPGAEGECELRQELDPVQKGHKIVYVSLPNLDRPDLGTMFGDFIHNTRSALDHLVCAVLRMNNKRIRGFHEYPFCVTRNQFILDVAGRDVDKRGPSCLAGMTGDQIGKIALHQPYIRGDARKARRSPLYLLHLAWNVDKHRRIHAGALNIATEPTVALTPSPYFTLRRVVPRVVPGTFLEPETVIADIQIAFRGFPPADAKPHVKTHMLASVAFRGEKGIVISHREMRQMLRDAVWAIRAFDSTFSVPW